MKSQTVGPRTDFLWDHDEPVPHLGQQRALLKKYPQLKELMGYEPLTKYILFSVVALQTFIAWYVADKSMWTIAIVSYLIGALCNSNMFLVTHELCHRLASPSRNMNKFFTLVANFPIGLPFGMTFGPYHLEHHMYMGQEGLDTDIPTANEALFFGNPNYSYPMRCFMKLLFMTTQIFFYALRPLFVRPETMALAAKDPWYVANTISQFTYDAILVYYAGWGSIIYLLLSTFWAGSFHPVAGHFLAEHYVFEGQGEHETFSYYGPLNFFTYNSGYHNIHHDLPNIPWSRLPLVREICGDYYNSLPECKSWGWCIVQYIFDDSVGPYSRKKRPTQLSPNVKTHTQMMEKFLTFLESRAFDLRKNKSQDESESQLENKKENNENMTVEQQALSPTSENVEKNSADVEAENSSLLSGSQESKVDDSFLVNSNSDSNSDSNSNSNSYSHSLTPQDEKSVDILRNRKIISSENTSNSISSPISSQQASAC